MYFIKKILLFLILLFLIGCTNYEYKEKEKIKYSLVIDEINLNLNYTIMSIKDDVNNLAMFKEYGRPNIEKTNTIMGAHSGVGPKALFNDITKLDIGDIIRLYYSNELYTYKVIEIKEVKDTDLSILDNTNKSILTLLTCKLFDSSKRIVVISEMVSN